MHETYSELALLLLISAGAGALAVRLRQPALIAYIVVGIVAGPAVLGLVSAHDQIDVLAQFGVTLLLFLVGLKLDLRNVRQIGPVALATGLGQLGFTIVFGFVLLLLLGKGTVEAIYVAVALTFSSTIIIVKLLSDKRELDSLHGRIAVGFLIVQDLAVVIAMMAMSSLGAGQGEGTAAVLLSLLGRVALAAVVIFVLMRYVLTPLLSLMARSQELLLVFAVAWATGLAALGEWAGFSKEAGAFLAGFSLASTPFRDAVGARLTGIRDFLLLFFFIDLGARLDFSTLQSELWPAAVLSVFVLVGNPLIVMAIMGWMGYRKRTGFLAGLTVAQISEFSIVFVAMGISLGHVGAQALGLTTLVGIVTIALSTYMILYSHALFDRIAPLLSIFERRIPFRESALEGGTHDAPRTDVIVFGLGRYGARMALGLREAGLSVMGVDFNPEVPTALRAKGLSVRFGDGSEPELLHSLPLGQTAWVVSTIPELEANRDLLRALMEMGYQGDIAIVARDPADGLALKQLGVPTVIYPMQNAVDYAVDALVAIIGVRGGDQPGSGTASATGREA